MALDRDSYRNKCINFNGISNKRCKAEISYASLGVKPVADGGPMMPCVMRERASQLGLPLAECGQFRAYTEAEIDARESQIEASMERHRKAAPVILKIRAANKGKTAHGAVDCPACGTGTLSWSISGYNGHMHGRCSTSGCLNWME